MVLGVSASEFERKCGLAHGFVPRVTRVITKATRQRIKAAYPTLNIEYIAMGVGDIFVKDGETHASIKDRLKAFLAFMNIGRREFAKRTGIAETMLSNMSDNLRYSSFERIYRAFPMLSKEWLEYGEGEMLCEDKETKTRETPTDRVKKVISFLGITTTAFLAETNMTAFTNNVTKRTIDKIVKRYPFINPMWLMHGKGDMYFGKVSPVISNLGYAPFVSQRVYTGYLNGLSDKEYMDSLDKIPYIEDDETKGNVLAIEVSGDSMDDGTAEGYCTGDIVLAKEVALDKVPFWKYDFVIVHKTGILIKRIVNISDKSITVHSLNSEYGDVNLQTSDIIKIFVVTTRISKVHRMH